MLKSKHRVLSLLSFLLSSGAVAAIVLRVAPSQAALWQLALLYLAIFLAAYALALLVIPRLRKQAALIALLAVVALFLNAQGMFSLLTGVLLLAIFTLIELYAISR